ncbi:MAE_28990/MAE_18760 family HEPN-like nuclease [Achromobacter xylosoxidans]|uniref:MAE_28990/MAE_18760 family HEPN-like nuclease n=1 Tax=Alcaligenes xylosoxydans xylosoxydans TaxID=85698 RepID=UPI0034D591D3
MKLLTEFQDSIQRELAWRKREISAIKISAMRVDDSAQHVFRSGQVILCAHWEGFLKKSVTLYISHVFSQKFKLREYSTNIISIAYFKDVMNAASAKYPGSDDHHIKLARTILDTLDEVCEDPGWSPDTEGNPGSGVLQRILKSVGLDAQLGMDAALWSTTKVFINDHLVKDRHIIAHGQNLPVVRESFLDRAERLIVLLDTLSGQLLDAAEARTYRSIRA